MELTEFSTAQAAHVSGASTRQLEYWNRNGVLVPSIEQGTGSGRYHKYGVLDIERAKVLAAVAPLGATSPVLKRIVDELAGDDLREWPLLLFVLVDGTVSHTIVPGVACYVVDVGGLCAAGFGRHRVRTLA